MGENQNVGMENRPAVGPDMAREDKCCRDSTEPGWPLFNRERPVAGVAVVTLGGESFAACDAAWIHFHPGSMLLSQPKQLAAQREPGRTASGTVQSRVPLRSAEVTCTHADRWRPVSNVVLPPESFDTVGAVVPVGYLFLPSRDPQLNGEPKTVLHPEKANGPPHNGRDGSLECALPKRFRRK